MKFLWLGMFLMLSFLTFSQLTNSNKRVRQLVTVPKDSVITIDTSAILPEAFQVYHNNQLLSDSLYDLHFMFGEVQFHENFDSLLIEYRVYPFRLQRTYQTLDSSIIGIDPSYAQNPFSTLKGRSNRMNIWDDDQLDKSGVLSRGISFGNNQNMAVQSNMNIQLNGALTDNIQVRASINDENIPFQPQGNTQKLQEFDNVFIEFTHPNHRLVAGDFVMNERSSSLMSFTKKAQGLRYENQTGNLETQVSGALARGRFARNQIQGLEGNQGPYKLFGANNELFIIILSGTERVFIDGELMERGQNYDYTIDYNTAEITFTPKQLITKDKRIIVEFQYSDQRYARSLIHINQDWKHKKWEIGWSVYSEQDSKNQPLQQTLTDESRQILADAGDDLFAAVTPEIDTVPFLPNEVLYENIDTLVAGNSFNVFRFSSDPDKAIYRLSFTNVGQGNGNYVLGNAGVNGRVYEWVAPVNGVSQGSYAPIRLLIPPERKQVFQTKVKYHLNDRTFIFNETALSNNDRNTFSSLDAQDNTGLSSITGISTAKPINNSDRKLVNELRYQIIQNEFNSVERIRSVEFMRDWNLDLDSLESDDHLLHWTIGLRENQNKALVTSTYYQHQGLLNAGKISSDVRWGVPGKWFIEQRGAFVQNQQEDGQFTFARQKGTVRRSFKKVQLQWKDEFEYNNRLLADSLLPSSYAFHHWRASVLANDTSKMKWELYYGQRTDQAVRDQSITPAAQAQETGVQLDFKKNRNAQLQLNSAYRNLSVLDTSLVSTPSDETFINRVNFRMLLFKGLINSTSFYELSGGQELEREFFYIKVPAGSGNYTWFDYNENGIQELNEFEVAQFSDQAEYIRVWRQTNNFITTFSNQFNQSLMINPSRVIESDKGLSGIIKRFSNQLSLQTSRKTAATSYWQEVNPFRSEIQDTSLISINSSVRNVIFFNKANPWFGLDYTYSQTAGKSLLTNGLDGRSLRLDQMQARWNFSRKWGGKLVVKQDNKSRTSEFFANNNYTILGQSIEPSFHYQPNVKFRLTLSGNVQQKANQFEGGTERLNGQELQMDFRYNAPKIGAYSGNIRWVNIDYNSPENTPIAFDMLEGLRNGQNFVWGLNITKDLNKSLQLNINYTGRKTGDNQVIHNGGMQVRAIF